MADEKQVVDALKLAYRHVAGDLDAGTNETMDALCDALCELIGDDAFQAFCEEFDGTKDPVNASEDFTKVECL